MCLWHIKTLCYHEENRSVKRGRTPWETYGADEESWAQILERVKKFGNQAKFRRFELRGEEELREFTERQMNDTRYTTRLGVDLLSTLYGGRDIPRADGTNRRVIHATTGMVTATLRRAWGVEAILREAVPSHNGESKGKPRTDHRHHAVDAIVIALTSQAMVQRMSAAAASAPSWQTGRRSFQSMESPWPDFVDSIRPHVTGMIVSHRPEHKMSGALHKETIYGRPYRFEGRSVVNLRRSVQGITPAQVMDIPDPAVRQAVEAKLSEYGGDSTKFNPEDARTLPSLVTNRGEHIPIRKVRVRETKNADALLELPGKRFVQSDEIHHVELFVQREGRKEVWTHRPVTLMEAYSRHRRNLSVVSRELEDDPSAEFLFSLMKGDMVELDYNGQRGVYRVKKFYTAGHIWFAHANNAQPDPSVPDAFVLKRGGGEWRTSHNHYEFIQRIPQNDEQFFRRWQGRCKDRLSDGADARTVGQLASEGLIHGAPEIIGGRIASGNTVGAARAFRDFMLRNSRTYSAIEMESAGFLKACVEDGGERDRIVLKAITDFGDERKERLDKLPRNAVRAWAMSNVFDLVSVLSPRLVHAVDPHGRAIVPMHDRQPLLAQSFELAQRHFKKQHQARAERLRNVLPAYGALFRCVLSSPRMSFGEDKDLFETLAAHIAVSDHPHPVRIDGKPGTGKTTFLTLLFHALHRLASTDDSVPIPIYINLKRYATPDRGGEEECDAGCLMEHDLRLLEEMPDKPVVILIDGIDEYVRYNESVEYRLMELIDRCPRARKIVGVGLNHFSDKDLYTRNTPILLEPQVTITLGDVQRTSAESQTFLRAFLDANRFDGHMSVDDLMLQAKRFRLHSIDLQTASMLFDSFDVQKYAKASSLSEFFYMFCQRFLRGHETLDDAAKLAFDYVVKGERVDVRGLAKKRAWKLLHIHITIVDYLIAYYVCSVVREAGRNPNTELSDLNWVYPYRINRFSKDIVNLSLKSQIDVRRGAQLIFEKGDQKAKPHACYLVGRLENANEKEKAKEWLTKSCKSYIEKLRQEKKEHLDRDELLLARTVYISLAYLGDTNASDTYISLLVSRKDWNDVNRGFHLEYYDDIPFDPEQQLSHRDPLAAFPRTFETLRERLEQHISDFDYGLFNIEVVTLYSLAQHRHAHRNLNPEVWMNLRDFIPKLMESEFLSEPVREYLMMLLRVFRKPYFAQGQVAMNLYRLKRVKRQGWVERKLGLARVESVADHTFGACLLAMLYLPDEGPTDWAGYDKSEIITTLLAHDLPEAFTGDITWKKQSEQTQRREQVVFGCLSMASTYANIADVTEYHRLYMNFENGTTLNGRIAKEIDRIENLFQMYLYGQKVQIHDFEVWRRSLVDSVRTDAGKCVLKIIQDMFPQRNVNPFRPPTGTKRKR